MTDGTGMDPLDEFINPQLAGMLTKMFSGISSLILDKKPAEAAEMAKICARQFNDIAAERGGTWKPLSDEEYLRGLEESRKRRRETQERWAIRNGITGQGAPVARIK